MLTQRLHSSGVSDRRRLWVGGSPCSGKSTIVDAMCRDYGLQAYHCDEHWERHVSLATPAREPCMSRLRTMTWDEIWSRDVPVQVEDELGIYREEFPLILTDLDDMPVFAAIVEGAALLPELVAPQITDRRQAIWIVPTEEFQRRVYRTRGPWVDLILAACSDPEAAWEQWMARDAAFALTVADQASALGLKAIWVDGQEAVEQVRVRVEAWLAPFLSA
jgi:hypothetical protein